MVMSDNEFKTKENQIETKDKIEPQHIYCSYFLSLWLRIERPSADFKVVRSARLNKTL